MARGTDIEHGVEESSWQSHRRRDDPILLDLVRLTGDEAMEALLRTGVIDDASKDIVG